MVKLIFLNTLFPLAFLFSVGCNSIETVNLPENISSSEIEPVLEQNTSPAELRIMSRGNLTHDQLVNYLLTYNKKVTADFANELALFYIHEAKIEGVNHDIAFAQMCHETGFLKFSKRITPDDHNYCGLGATDNGGKPAVFESARIGVRAHIQHLKAYACTTDLATPLVDPRFKFVKRGSATHLDDLVGKWATDKNYAIYLRKHLIRMAAKVS